MPFAFICKKYNSARGKFGSRIELDCREISPILYANVKRCKVMYMREVRNLHALKCMNLCNLNSYLLRVLTILLQTGGNQECIFMQTNGLFHFTVCIFISAFDNSALMETLMTDVFHSYFPHVYNTYLSKVIKRHLIKFCCTYNNIPKSIIDLF